MQNLQIRAAVLLSLGGAGIVALVLFEVARALGAPPVDVSHLPPEGILVVMLCLVSAAVIACFFASNKIVRWAALVIAVLVALFHAMHVLEHGAMGDINLGGLILFMMFAPSALAAHALWKCGKTSDD